MAGIFLSYKPHLSSNLGYKSVQLFLVLAQNKSAVHSSSHTRIFLPVVLRRKLFEGITQLSKQKE